METGQVRPVTPQIEPAVGAHLIHAAMETGQVRPVTLADDELQLEMDLEAAMETGQVRPVTPTAPAPPPPEGSRNGDRPSTAGNTLPDLGVVATPRRSPP